MPTCVRVSKGEQETYRNVVCSFCYLFSKILFDMEHENDNARNESGDDIRIGEKPISNPFQYVQIRR